MRLTRQQQAVAALFYCAGRRDAPALLAAMERVRQGESIRAAAAESGIAPSTLRGHLTRFGAQLAEADRLLGLGRDSYRLWFSEHLGNQPQGVTQNRHLERGIAAES